MSDINKVLRAAAVRLCANRFLAMLVVMLSAAAVFAIGARLTQQAFGVGINWAMFAWLAPAAAVVLAAIGAVARPVSQQKVARVVDQGADLKESLSTALTVRGSTDPWATNVMETAMRAARGVRVSAAVPVRAPGYWPTPLALALAFAAVWFILPKLDLLGSQSKQEAKRIEQEQIEQAKGEAKVAVSTAQKKAEEAMKRLGEDDTPETAKAENVDKPTTPEEIRRAALKQLTSMKDKLEQMKLSDKAMKADATLEKMKGLRMPGKGPLEDFAQSLAQGKMSQASEALAELGKQMAAGQMNPQQAEQAKTQLENLAKQLEKLAAERKKLEEQLAKSGVDPKLAASPEALKEALKNNPNLSQAQKDQLQKEAQAQESACQSCQSMAQAAQQMAQSMSNTGQMGAQGSQAMADMQAQLSQMEMAEADMKSIEAAMSECQNAMNQMGEGMGQCSNPGEGECAGGQGQAQGDGNGAFKQGESEANGAGRGGPGISQGGGGVGEEQDAEKWQKRKARTALGEGPMIGTMLVQGEQIKGESKQQFVEMAAAAEQQATEAMSNNQIPREYRDVVKRYFSTVVKKAGEAAKPSAEPVATEKK